MDIIANILAAPFVCIGWIIVGAIAGALAHSFMRTNQPLISDIIVGLIGSFIGGLIVSLLGLNRPEGGITGVLASILIATIGAIVLLYIIRAVRRS